MRYHILPIHIKHIEAKLTVIWYIAVFLSYKFSTAVFNLLDII